MGHIATHMPNNPLHCSRASDRSPDLAGDRWHLNGFNLCEIIVIRNGPAPDGKTYIDGRHQLSVRHCATMDEARRAVDEHNAGLAV